MARFIGDVLLALAIIPAVLSPMIFATLKSWKNSALGIHLMVYMALIAGQLILAGIYNIADPGEWFNYLRFSWFALVVSALWWRLFIIVKAKKRGTNHVD